MKTNQTNCKNCEQPYDEGFQFCPHCGQKTNDELTIGVLFYNTISNYFSFDARFIKSFIPLLFKPGYLAKEFIKGKRLLYLHPAQMYLFISVVFFFIFSFTVRNQTELLNEELRKTLEGDDVSTVVDSLKISKSDSLSRLKIKKALKDNQYLTRMSDAEIDSIVSLEKLPKKTDISFDFNEAEIDSLIRINAPDTKIYKAMGLEEDDGWFKTKLYEQALKFYKARDGGNILHAFYDTIPIALFFLLPIFALIIKLLYFRKGRYAHHLVFSFYFFSYLFTVFSIIFGVNLIWDIPDWIDWLVALSTFFYLMAGLKNFYGRGWFVSWFKCSIATFMFMTIVIPTTAIIIALYAFMFY
ncbi:DUF3667 domain-containing protein [Winogradskyella endarachnes]|uniref:DUF3667 domain-containing protein n=1 Tax=Winogradskyella endarachnes TaxID=2681965 RepID=A0A6L6U8S9_9FLAO|nr:DUF3667 domain-containing protein [Winogradskyella endarachnes]MUU77317.1 DUF3667 domain-containing protein [Winogradskyella endarachnes]